uniref:aspartate/glutamate racemase family protein n=1 Tax=Thaumasiovibrio occultus TaxID=1891184 RepID=UPI000B358AC8|nr:aspartate/glutamate racemase family protein [Thaumasiovibrio occultus]
MSNAQRIGVIGGLGNEAMVDLLEKIALDDLASQQEFVAFGNARLAYKPEEVGKNWLPDSQTELRKRDTATYTLRLLQHLGADKLGLACNSAHPLFRPLAEQLPIPFVDMIKQTAAKLSGTPDKVMVLGVNSLVNSGLYQNTLEADGVSAMRASEAKQELVMDAIYNPVYGIKTAQITPQAEQQLCDVITAEYQAQRCTKVVLGCTELPLALTPSSCERFKAQGMIPAEVDVVDASAVLANALVHTQGERQALAQPLQSYFGEHTDWFAPLAFAVDSLTEAAEIQKAIFTHTLAYLKDNGKALTGSYWHLPTLFFSASASDITEKLAEAEIAVYTKDTELAELLPSVMAEYYVSLA